MNVKKIFVGLILISSFLNLNAGEKDAMLPPFVHVPPAKKAPVIDGNLSPGEWDDAFMGTGIVPYRRGGLDPIEVQYWFTYDSKNIYLAARMQIPPGENYATKGRRLAGGGPSGHFELLIDPFSCNQDQNWVQAMLYPLGIYKNIGYSQRIGGYVPYDVEWNYRDSVKDGFWNVELSAPAEALNRASLASGNVWGILFAGAMKSSIYYFSGTLGLPFNQRQRYYKMILDKDAPLIQIPDIGDVTSGTITPIIRVNNTTAKKLKGEVIFEVQDKLNEDQAKVLSSKSFPVTVAPGQKKDTSWSLKLPASGIEFLNMKVIAQGKILYDGVYRLEKLRTPTFPPPKDKVSAKEIIVENYPFPYANQIKTLIDFGGIKDPGKVEKIQAVLKTKGGEAIVTGNTVEFDNNAGEIILEIPKNLARGSYRVEIDLFDKNGKKLGSASDDFEKKIFPFEHNKLGVSNKVLSPWTPIRADSKKNILSVWGRTYTLDKTGLPGSVITKGEQILEKPIHFLVMVKGKQKVFKGVNFCFTEITDTFAKGTAIAICDGITALINLTAEYDGMLKYEVTFTGNKDLIVDRLDLILPIKKENGLFVHATGDGCRSNYSHAVPKGKGVVWDSNEVMNWVMPKSWLTYIWLGDHARGLCWWADSAKGWTLPRKKSVPTVKIVRQPKSTQVVFNIISRPTSILWKGKEPRRIVFALEATPIKKKPSWARDIGLCNANVTKQKGKRFHWVGNSSWAFPGKEHIYGGGVFKKRSGKHKVYPYSFAYLRPVDKECETNLKKMTDGDDKKNLQTLVYTDMRARTLSHDEMKYYTWEWSPNQKDIRKAVIQNATPNRNILVSSTQSRIDHDLWCLAKGMDLGIDCWYFDEIQNEGQINPLSGCGYQDEDGNWMPTMRLFQYRDFWKRLYTMMQERGYKEPVIVMHNTSTTFAGPMAFCTTTWDYEECNQDPKKRQLTKFGMDYLLTETMGHQYGFVASTLGPAGGFEPWLKDYPEEKESANRHWMGIHMLLDMNPYLRRDKAIQDGLKILGDFEWNKPDCQWIPFWEAKKQKLYRVVPDKNIYVSAYKRGNKMLLVMLNDTNKDTVVKWIPGEKLNVNTMKDAESGKNIPSENNGYSIQLPHYNYRTMILDLK